MKSYLVFIPIFALCVGLGLLIAGTTQIDLNILLRAAFVTLIFSYPVIEWIHKRES